MKCPSCGIDSKTKFCGYCGAQVYDSESFTQNTITNSEQESFTPIGNDNHNKSGGFIKKFLLVVIGLLLFAVFVITIFPILPSDNSTPGTDANTSANTTTTSNTPAETPVETSAATPTDTSTDISTENKKLQAQIDALNKQMNTLKNIKIKDVNWYVDGDYIYYKAKIKNETNVPLSYIKVEVTYRKTKTGDVIDTDWAYAVDSDPLQPGYSKSFEIMTSNTEGINWARSRVVDYREN